MRRILKTLFWGVVCRRRVAGRAACPAVCPFEAGSYTMQTSDSIAVISLLLLFLVLYGVVRLVTRVVLYVPRAGSLWRGGRRRRAGDQAVTRDSGGAGRRGKGRCPARGPPRPRASGRHAANVAVGRRGGAAGRPRR